MCDVASSLDFEEEAVQMHGMGAPRRVDEPPPYAVTQIVREPLGVRPWPAVDREELASKIGFALFVGSREPHR